MSCRPLLTSTTFPQYNGIDKHGHGLPPRLGAMLTAKYASGEAIYAYNNHEVFAGGESSLAIFDYFRELAREAGFSFYSQRNIEEFQTFHQGRKKDLEREFTLVLEGNSIKIYAGEKLTDDTTYYFIDDKPYNAESEDGSFNLYTLIEWHDGCLIGHGMDGKKTEFYGLFEEEKEE